MYCKLKPSILDNSRYGLLPDRAWRRLLELYLLACKINNKGQLPSIESIAWHLHILDTEQLKEDIAILLERKFLAVKGNDESALIIRHFDQISAISSTERVRAYRKRKTQNGCTGYDAESIKRRDEYKCVYCGSTDDLAVDHIYPIILGSTDDYNNLACSCKACNSGKGGRTPVQAGMTFKNKLAEERYQIYLEDVLR